MKKSEKKGPYFLGRHGPISKFTYPQIKSDNLAKTDFLGLFFRFDMSSGPKCTGLVWYYWKKCKQQTS